MRRENRSLLDCLQEANPPLADDERDAQVIERYLRRHPALVAEWQRLSDDTRGSPNHYLDGCEVGFYDSGFHDRSVHPDEIAACADFAHRTALWVLARRRVVSARRG